MARAVTVSVGDYVSRINAELRPSRRPRHTVLDLFAGCGGLSLGFESAGFRSRGIESNRRCCETYNANLRGRCDNAVVAPDADFPDADVVIGGPPCQPFSVFGYQQGDGDARNGFPSFVSAVRRIRPRMWMFENVRGMMYRNRAYLESVLADLRGLGYRVECGMLNAVDYGVPQNRLRVIAVGHRGGFEFPAAEARAVTSGEAVGDTAGRCGRDPKFLTPSMDRYVAVYEKKSQLVTPRDLHLDRPARTVTCRNLAGATSDMHRVRLPDGRRRRLTVGEGARLQSFPDWFRFSGTETDMYSPEHMFLTLSRQSVLIDVVRTIPCCGHNHLLRRPGIFISVNYVLQRPFYSVAIFSTPYAFAIRIRAPYQVLPNVKVWV